MLLILKFQSPSPNGIEFEKFGGRFNSSVYILKFLFDSVVFTNMASLTLRLSLRSITPKSRNNQTTK